MGTEYRSAAYTELAKLYLKKIIVKKPSNMPVKVLTSTGMQLMRINCLQ